MFDRPSPDPAPADLPFGEAAIYDRILWDGALDADQARDLRAPARLWAQVRPLPHGLHA